ncbi:hypothetical protein [Virgibacillus subterraneus]|nr:hypothetical protein [Virgibacillus subterraneus]
MKCGGTNADQKIVPMTETGLSKMLDGFTTKKAPRFEELFYF